MKYWYDVLTIDKGKKDGIKKGDAVINSEGLIGKVIKVNNKSSDIKLIISSTRDNYISAAFTYEENVYYGIIDKYDTKKQIKIHMDYHIHLHYHHRLILIILILFQL